MQAQCARLVLAADPAYPPLHWYDGATMQGASIAIAKRVLEDLKVPYEVRYLGPLPRVLAAAQRGDIDMVATLKKTPEREQFLLYPSTPALSNPVAVFTSRERPIAFKSRADLVGLKGGITRGNVFGYGFDEFMRQNLSIEEAGNPEHNFSKLSLGRIDYFITGYYAGLAYLQQREDQDRFAANFPFLVDTPNYLTLTRRGQCANLLPAINERLLKLAKGGVLDELTRQNFELWKSKPVLKVD